MSYNNHHRRGHHDSSHSSTNYYQRTIPEMLAARPDNRSDNNVTRSNKNVRFVELKSELAVAPASSIMPTPNNSYYPTMCVPYEAPTSHQASYSMQTQFQPQQQQSVYHQTPTPQQAGPSYFYERQPPTTPQTMRYQTQQTPAHQLYYGVPGFYTPNFGSSYGEPTTPQSSHEASMCDDMFMGDVATTPRPLSSTSRRPQHQQQFQKVPPDTMRSPERPAQLPMSSNVVKKRSSAESTPSVTERQSTHEELMTSKKQPRFTMEEATGSDTKIKNRMVRSVAPALHVFSGSVQRVIKWEGLRDLFPVIFEVIAPLKAVRRAATHQELLLRDEAGPVLQVLFYEIDREMPPLVPGQLVRAVGRLISRTRLQAFSVRAATDVERVSLQRISFVCNRTASQLLQPPNV